MIQTFLTYRMFQIGQMFQTNRLLQLDQKFPTTLTWMKFGK
jgi:hypothetical protein